MENSKVVLFPGMEKSEGQEELVDCNPIRFRDIIPVINHSVPLMVFYGEVYVPPTDTEMIQAVLDKYVVNLTLAYKPDGSGICVAILLADTIEISKEDGTGTKVFT